MAEEQEQTGWAIILGASSGFGGATALALAAAGFHICGVHLDLRAHLAGVEEIIRGVEATGRQAAFFNVNAADAAKRQEVLAAMESRLAGDGFRVLLHSLAFGTLQPFISPASDPPAISQRQVEMTLDVMAHSLVYWTQDLLARNLLRRGSRILAMTSAGGSRVIPHYGAVSAAKAALESHIRQLAMELAPRGITANAILAGVTDTPALRRIPGHDKISAAALSRNPSGRLTTPEDVARFIVMWAGPGSQWATGNVLQVDGGEEIVG
ncbi:MAG TPA: SDR family oxidoreductase [Chloroflexia bacterium]|nr:SDR family oxidoreductase [Chloroflexia bacterium]